MSSKKRPKATQFESQTKKDQITGQVRGEKKDMTTHQGYSNRGGANEQAVKGALRGHRER